MKAERAKGKTAIIHNLLKNNPELAKKCNYILLCPGYNENTNDNIINSKTSNENN